MRSPIRSELIEDSILRVKFEDQVLFDYTYRSDAIQHYSPRPYMHPIRTLAGDTLTNVSPVYHPWHNGLSMTLNHVNGMNFWGGGTYRRKTGRYEDLPNVGKQVHREWLGGDASNSNCSWVETLNWIGPNEDLVFTEKRTLTVCDIDPELGLWRLIWDSSMTNVSGAKLAINSYASGERLEGSGYTGLFLRMSLGYARTPFHIFQGEKPEWDDYHDGESIIEPVEAINGWKSNRLAHQGVFDGSLHGCLLLCEDLTENPPYELHWFHRPEFPYLAWSTAFYKSLLVEADSTIHFRHALGIVNGFWTKDRAKGLWVK